ncbi:hypothetical protein OQA88_4029 [Cercophora sp. LCS_1]
MSSLGLAQDELKQLDLMRNRFLQLASSLISLQKNVITTQPLPSRESLQASALILLQNVKSIQEITNENAELFSRIAVHPSTNFPGRTQEHILLTLLRKKLEPDVETRVEEARETARSAGLDASKLASGKIGGGYGDDDDGVGYEEEGGVPEDPFNELWADIRDACFEGIKEFIETQASEAYTVAEKELGTENVRTGLKRNLEEDSEEDDDEEEEEEEMVGQGTKGAVIGGNALQPEHVLWFAARGDLSLPPNIELESQRRAREAKRPGAAR